MEHPISERIRESIREIPDFPKPGINFYDITTVMLNGELFASIIDVFAERYQTKELDAVVGIEARGFVFGSCLAYKLGTAFVPIRKPGKPPSEVHSTSYALEYGEDTLEIHRDALQPGSRVAIIDDLLATGGTAKASVQLIEQLGANVVECGFMAELSFLQGRERLGNTPLISLVKYTAEE